MLVDSHCHLNFPELVQNMDQVLESMRSNQVGHALCVSVTLDKFPEVLAIAEQYPNIYASVGVHPDYENITEPTVQGLVELTNHPRVVAIGETGLDYFRLTGDLSWQRERFRTHIRAARQTGKPLIIHTRNAAEDTIKIMQEEGAAEVGGVMHCFTESWEVAQAAIAMGFYISFSGIVTFKNAQALKDVAQKVPLASMLVETDSPYLAPIPFRGKTNQPAYVRHVAEEIARLREQPLQQIMDATTANFFKLFKHAQPCN
ncbi:TatD family hydrolase [Methylophilus sp. VKM B-3414]|uniref:TatD family hydrolase n=1 Tax=Methylophilus sp. VKM B-3414 TaxID=3076121 RepID=UPI0028C75C78|nr:TatD family hydrolase [Methylophilus sp. VKM B-3414]MDT7850637.1 TatD family hydrolase [Methylophilus sp. VKM B-3414]